MLCNVLYMSFLLLHLHISFHYFDFFHSRFYISPDFWFYYFSECIIKWQNYAPLLHFVLCLYIARFVVLFMAGIRNDCKTIYDTYIPAETLKLYYLHVHMSNSGWCIVWFCALLRESSLHVKSNAFYSKENYVSRGDCYRFNSSPRPVHMIHQVRLAFCIHIRVSIQNRWINVHFNQSSHPPLVCTWGEGKGSHLGWVESDKSINIEHGLCKNCFHVSTNPNNKPSMIYKWSQLF